MKMFLITDREETAIGLRLAGVDGVVVNTDDELEKEFYRAMNDKTIGVILVTPHINLPEVDEPIVLKWG